MGTTLFAVGGGEAGSLGGSGQLRRDSKLVRMTAVKVGEESQATQYVIKQLLDGGKISPTAGEAKKPRESHQEAKRRLKVAAQALGYIPSDRSPKSHSNLPMFAAKQTTSEDSQIIPREIRNVFFHLLKLSSQANLDSLSSIRG